MVKGSGNQTALAMIPVAATVTAVNWGEVVGTALLAGLASLLTSVVGLPEVKGAIKK